MDYPALTLGHREPSKRTLDLVDLTVHVYGLDEIRNSQLPISVIIASHGRCNSVKNMHYFAVGLCGELRRLARAGARAKTHDVLVVTLVRGRADHRNHGARLKHRTANLAFDQNPMHLLAPLTPPVGAVQDHQFIIEFLPVYLFPNDERVVTQWMATGISLGGNTVWRLLAEEPRIRIGVPIIGLPPDSFVKYLSARAVSAGLKLAPPTFPASLRPWMEKKAKPGAYDGKKILTLHGAGDELVPYRYGQEDIRAVLAAAAEGEVEIWVQDGVGHICSPEMLGRTAQWFWRWGLSEPKQA
ncbi:hypothetical protein VHUM_02589 [Vanrija humicola]|uniref:Peptidase S9 prolyl oligopeptidase catalytic domain-containing protein n=1 Tax=Vanrija humicola TaxID=5417 RepID=A0A7D8UZ90_VANHU|nr:hypothetical protein VHUM_02589 [Vanrija humicola]